MHPGKMLWFGLSWICFWITPCIATKYTAAFLNHGAGARALGMGGSFTALGADATTIHWNPAALGCVFEPELVLMHAAEFDNFLKYDTGHLVWPNTISGSFGIGYLRLATGDIYFTNNLPFRDWGLDNLPNTGDPGEGNGLYDRGERVLYDPTRLEIVNDTEEALFLAYAYPVTRRLALGGNLKLLRQSIGAYSSFGWGFDFGAFYQATPRLNLALNLQDALGTTVRWQSGHTDVRTINVRPGLAYRLPLPALKSQLHLATDVDLRFDKLKSNCDGHLGPMSFDFHLGLEYWLYQMLALRVGSEQQSLTAGVGLRLSFFEIDYAFSGFELGNTHRISLTLHRPGWHKKTRMPVTSEPVSKVEMKTPETAPVTKTQPPEAVQRPLKADTTKIVAKPATTTPAAHLSVAKSIGSIEFDLGSMAIRPENYPILRQIATELQKFPNQMLHLKGHTDDRPIATELFPSNQALSLKRAAMVKMVLSEQMGIEPQRMVIFGLGDTEPLTDNMDEAHRQQNRRVEIIVSPEIYQK